MNTNSMSYKTKQYIMFAGVTTLIFAAVVIVPFIYGLYLTFTSWDGVSRSKPFVGFANYIATFQDSAFWAALGRTFIYSFVAVILVNVVAFILAYLVTRGVKGQNFFRAGFFVPNLIGGAEDRDLDMVKTLYWEIIDSMKGAPFGPGWKKGIYHSDDFLYNAVHNRELYLLEDNQEPVAVMVLNHQWTQGYEMVKWAVQADRDQVMMIHALGLLRSCQGKGMGKLLVEEALKIAKENRQKAVRLDVLSGNIPAQRLYESMGFQYRETLKLYYEDTGLTDYLLYEFVLRE